jgi:hypothetical protein
MKTCSKCGELKEYEEFPRRGDSWRSECKVCHREACRQHYNDNKQYYFARNRERKDWLRKIVLFYKDQPCVDCGVQYEPRLMEFDHLGEEVKLAKCEVVCPNDHKRRTYERLDAAKATRMLQSNQGD